jgi:quinoprotein relay system zinc metallohydrolase 2
LIARGAIVRARRVAPALVIAITCGFATSLPFPALSVASTDDATLDVSEISPGVFVHRGHDVALDAPGHDDIANIGFIVGTRCVAVVDTGGSVRTGRALRGAIGARTKLPVCYVIDTHVHVDHVLGNFAFAADKPHFVGSARLAAAVAASRAYFVEHYAGDFDGDASGGQVIAPDEPVADTRDIDLGGRVLHLRAWPNAHTDSDLTVLVDDKVLWTGDLVFRERVPALDGSLVGWLAALSELAAIKAGWIVPGHGEPTRDLAAAIAEEKHYLDAIARGVRAELDAGQPIEHAMQHVAQDEKSRWKLFDTANAGNVSRAYRELEWQ